MPYPKEPINFTQVERGANHDVEIRARQIAVVGGIVTVHLIGDQTSVQQALKSALSQASIENSHYR